MSSIRREEASFPLPDSESADSPCSAHSYPGCREAALPSQLAACLDRFDARGDLFSGRISQWVKHFDRYLADQIVELEETMAGDPEQALRRLRYVLQPGTPLMIHDVAIYSLEEIKALANQDDAATRESLALALENGEFAFWIETLPDFNGKTEFLKKMLRLPIRPGLNGVQSPDPILLWNLLLPGKPLILSGNIPLHHPGELNNILLTHPELIPEVEKLLGDGRLESWLRELCPVCRRDAHFLAQCRKQYEFNVPLALFAVCCHFDPRTPLTILEEQIYRLKELERRSSASPILRKEAVRLMNEGVLRVWLTESGRLPHPESYDQWIRREGISDDEKLAGLWPLLDSADSTPLSEDAGNDRHSEVASQTVVADDPHSQTKERQEAVLTNNKIPGADISNGRIIVSLIIGIIAGTQMSFLADSLGLVKSMNSPSLMIAFLLGFLPTVMLILLFPKFKKS